MRTRPFVLVVCLLFIFASPLFARKGKDNIDALSKKPNKQARELTPDEKKLIKAGSRLHLEERLGVPTFVTAAPGASRGQGRGRAEAEPEARRHLSKFASLYELEETDLTELAVTNKHDRGKGAVLVTFHSKIENIEVFREQITVAMNQDFDLLALSGYTSGRKMGAERGFSLSSAMAVARALSDLRDEQIASHDLQVSATRESGYGHADLTAELRATRPEILVDPARFKQVYYPLPDELVPAWYVEVSTSITPAVDAEGVIGDVTSDSYSYVISAVDGEILFRNNLTVDDSFSYRMWADTSGAMAPFPDPTGHASYPHPTGTPDGFQGIFVAPNLVTLQNGPISTNDPWLAPGSTVTSGNNADAYADLVALDGFTPPTDFRATTTGPNTFDRAFDPFQQANASQNQRMASITSLFYMNNWLHDFFYDAGFDEASRNAQTNNFGRGGLGNDNIRAEAQDFGGVNNANMFTPADGSRPRMQMFLFGVAQRFLHTNAQPSPATIPSPLLNVGVATLFGLQTFNVTADVVAANDGVDDPMDACTALPAGSLTGKIALVNRGGLAPGGAACGFALKAQNAAAAGARGILIANVASSANPTVAPGMGGTCTPVSACTNIAAYSLNLATGNLFRAAVAAGTVNVTMSRSPDFFRDGTIDNQIVAHEFGHYVSNRLIGNSAGLVNQVGRGMGEGWSDFQALLITVHPDDILSPANANWNGVYTMSGYATANFSPQNYYFGIRRLPYSTDFTKNALTFKHIMDGVPLPAGVPTSPNSNANSQVHNTGEIWSSMLWECYAALLRDTLGPTPRLTFAEAQQRMKEYLITAFKLTPIAPTMLEARDAVLTAAFANDPIDGSRFCQAFAKRGAGIRAVAPDRFSLNNTPLTESFVCGNDLAFVDASLTVIGHCDGDDFFDSRETAQLLVTIRNVGEGTLSNTIATVTSSNPAVSIANGGVMAFPPAAPFTSSTASVDVGLFGAAGIQNVTFDIAIEDPSLAFPGPVGASFAVAANADSLPNSSATDDVESPDVAWASAKTGTGGVLFSRLQVSVFDHRWFAPNAGQPADVHLTSPALHVGGGNFSFTFRHRFSFEGGFFDGGVVEISTNGGGTWTDIGNAFASPGYNGTLVASGSNPLRGRRAWLNTMPGYPNFRTETVNLGTAFAGQTVHIRFRHGADDNTAGPGWDIDDISFQGITNTPFATIVAHNAACAVGRVLVTQLESIGGHNPTLNEWVELRNVSGTAIDLIGLQICDDQSLSSPGQCDTITQHYVLDSGAGVVFAADRNVFLGNHPGYPASRVLDDGSDSLIGSDGFDNNGDGAHLFDPASPAVSADCVNYHNSTSCFAQGVVKDDGADSLQRSLTDPAPKLRGAWFRAPEVLP